MVITVIMLPSVEPSMIPAAVLPLLIFVNVKSGGCQVRQQLQSNFLYWICVGFGAYFKF